MGSRLVAKPEALDRLATTIEGSAADIDRIITPQVTDEVRRLMPGSPLVSATDSATRQLRNATTVVSGQWETFASMVRASRRVMESADDEASRRFSTAGDLPAPKA